MLRLTTTVLALSLPALAQAKPFARLPADATTVMAMGDLLPHAQQLLEVPEVARLIEAAAPMLEDAFGAAPTAAQLKGQLGLISDLVPARVEIGAPTRTSNAFFRFLQMMAGAVVLMPMQFADVDEELAAAVRAELDEGVAGMARLDATVVATMRSERAAEQALERLRGLLRGLDAAAGVEVDVDGDALRFAADLREVGDGEFTRMLERFELEFPAAGARFEASLAQDGADLVLTIGEPGDGPFVPEGLGRLWDAQDPPLMFTKVTNGILDDYLELVDVVAEAAGSDSEFVATIAMQMYETLANASSTFEHSTSSLVVDGGGVRIDTDEPVDPEWAEWMVVPDAVVRTAAASRGPTIVADEMLDVLLVDVVDAVDFFLLMTADRSVYEQLPGLCEYINADESALFGSGFSLLTRPAAFRSAEGAQLGAMPWAVGALVAPADDPESARAFMDAIGGHLVDDLGLDAQPWQKADLGLGVDTYSLDVAKVAPGLAALGCDWDFEPHWCVVGTHLVLSTDRALSKDAIAQLQADGGGGDARPNQRVEITGATLQALLGAGREWAAALGADEDSLVESADMLDAVSALFGRVATVRIDGDLVGDQLRTRFDLRFR